MQTLTLIELLYILKHTCTANNFYERPKSTKTWFKASLKSHARQVTNFKVHSLNEMVVVVHLTGTVSWTIQSCPTFWVLAIQIPVISTASSSVVCIISEWQGPLGIFLCAPSTAALVVTLALRASVSFFEAHSTRWNAVGRCRFRLDLPSVTATPTSVVGIITEILCPRWALAPTGARTSWTLT